MAAYFGRVFAREDTLDELISILTKASLEVLFNEEIQDTLEKLALNVGSSEMVREGMLASLIAAPLIYESEEDDSEETKDEYEDEFEPQMRQDLNVN